MTRWTKFCVRPPALYGAGRSRRGLQPPGALTGPENGPKAPCDTGHGFNFGQTTQVRGGNQVRGNRVALRRRMHCSSLSTSLDFLPLGRFLGHWHRISSTPPPVLTVCLMFECEYVVWIVDPYNLHVVEASPHRPQHLECHPRDPDRLWGVWASTQHGKIRLD